MLITYILFAHDNGAYFFKSAPQDLFCPICGSCLDESFVPGNLKIPKKFDIGSTYDNRMIASKNFKYFCDELYPGEIDFSPVTPENDFFYLRPCRILEFDAEKRKTNFKNYCGACGHYESVTGVTPGFIKNQSEPIRRGFYRSDIEFGSGRGKSFVIFIGIETKEEIIRRKFSKPDIHPIYDEMKCK